MIERRTSRGGIRDFAPHGYVLGDLPSFFKPRHREIRERINIAPERAVGTFIQREAYGLQNNPDDVVVIIGGRGSFTDWRDHNFYKLLADSLAGRGYGVLLYTFDRSLMTEDADLTQENLAQVRDIILGDMQETNTTDKTTRKAILATSQGSVVAMMVAAKIEEELFVGLNVPAANDKRYPAAPDLAQYMPDVADHVRRAHITYSRHDQYFDRESRIKLVKMWREFVPGTDVVIDGKYGHIFTALRTVLDFSSILEFLEESRNRNN